MLFPTAMTQMRLVLSSLLLITSVSAQEDNLGFENGYITVETANFNIKLVKDAQVLASLRPSTNDAFDFLPFDYLPFRAANGQYHNGDITYRVRPVGETDWTDGDSSAARNPVTALNQINVLAAASMTPTLPSNNSSLQATRKWLDVDGDLGLTFTLTNIGKQPLEIGSLGFPTEFNSIFTNRTAEDIEANCSLTDPYIGLDAGYLQVTPTSGTGAALIVTPLQGYNSTPFEAWRNLDEISYAATQYGSQVFEGFYEWQMHSKAYAENEWSGVEPWNTPTSQILEAGNSITVGLRFSLVKAGVRGIQDAVHRQTNTPLTIGVPGYVIPQDLTAHLYIFHPTAAVSNITADANSFNIASSQTNVYTLTPTGSLWGRTKVTIQYADGSTQTVHYFVTNSATEAISQMSQFATTSMWFDDSSDPFGRSPSIITWDHSIGAQVLQEQRVWISGLSDEGGVIYLATAMKQSAQPNPREIAKLEQFVSQVLSTTLQGHPDYSVRKSIFYYEPSLLPGYAYNNSIDWGNWWSWDQSDAYNTQRAYDYIHVTATYWALYRAGRADPSSLTDHTWDWYLGHAYSTTITCFATDSFGNGLVGYSSDGLMGETVIGELLLDLQREGWSTEAEIVETLMKGRVQIWNQEAVPFGSEMAWDSTGQEGVYYWSKYVNRLLVIYCAFFCHYRSSSTIFISFPLNTWLIFLLSYFNLTATATKSVNSILGYMPTVSHWGWNGCARRYWDFM